MQKLYKQCFLTEDTKVRNGYAARNENSGDRFTTSSNRNRRRNNRVRANRNLNPKGEVSDSDKNNKKGNAENEISTATNRSRRRRLPGEKTDKLNPSVLKQVDKSEVGKDKSNREPNKFELTKEPKKDQKPYANNFRRERNRGNLRGDKNKYIENQADIEKDILRIEKEIKLALAELKAIDLSL